MDATEVADRVHRLAHAHVNCYLVEDDDGVTLVDAGLPSMWSMVLRALEETENALVRHARAREEDALLEQAAIDSARAAGYARVRFDAGATSLLEVDADRRSVIRYGNGYTGYLAEKAAALDARGRVAVPLAVELRRHEELLAREGGGAHR